MLSCAGAQQQGGFTDRLCPCRHDQDGRQISLFRAPALSTESDNEKQHPVSVVNRAHPSHWFVYVGRPNARKAVSRKVNRLSGQKKKWAQVTGKSGIDTPLRQAVTYPTT